MQHSEVEVGEAAQASHLAPMNGGRTNDWKMAHTPDERYWAGRVCKFESLESSQEAVAVAAGTSREDLGRLQSYSLGIDYIQWRSWSHLVQDVVPASFSCLVSSVRQCD